MDSPAVVQVGLVAVDHDARWIGGRYYLHHLVRCVRSDPSMDWLRFSALWWGSEGPSDAFGDVAGLLDATTVVRPPIALLPRILRYVRRRTRGITGARDLFAQHGVSAVFPVAPCRESGLPFMYWLPDFQYLHLPELFSPELRSYYEQHYASQAELADIVVVSSEHAATDFKRVFGHLERKLRILRFCSVPTDEWYSLEPAAVAAKHDVRRPYFIISNQFSHHKNHQIVFQAMRELADRGVDVDLVCTGSTFGFRGQDYFLELSELLRDSGLTTRIKVLGLIPRPEQIALSRGAIAMLQPSRFEGWSTVIEDGLALGQDIIASDFPVHVEQLRHTANALLRADDVSAWADAMEAAARGHSSKPSSQRELLARDWTTMRMQTCARQFGDIVRDACRLHEGSRQGLAPLSKTADTGHTHKS